MQLYSDDPASTFVPYFIAFLPFPNMFLYNAISAVNYPMIVNSSITYSLSDYLSPENLLFWAYVMVSAAFSFPFNTIFSIMKISCFDASQGVFLVVFQGVGLMLLHRYVAEKHAPLFRKEVKLDLAELIGDVPRRSRRDTDVALEETFVRQNLHGHCDRRELPAFMCDRLSLTYRRNECSCRETDCKQAVNGLTMSVMQPQIFGLLGPNGAGKTSTLKIVVGSERADEGMVYVGGKPIATMSIQVSLHLHLKFFLLLT